LGALVVIYVLLWLLARIFKLAEWIYLKFANVLYALGESFNKNLQKSRIRGKLRELILSSESEFVKSFEYDLDVEWSERDMVEVDLEESRIIFRIKYEKDVRRAVAKLVFMMAPYTVSPYLASVLEEELAHLISIGIARDLAARDPIVLKEFNNYVSTTFGGNDLLRLIEKIEGESLLDNILLFEVRMVVEEYKAKIAREEFTKDVKDMIHMLADLDSKSEPLICGTYIAVTVVRAGKLEKIALSDFQGYVEYILKILNKCRHLRRVYIISAGKKIAPYVAKELRRYLEERVKQLVYIREVMYTAPLYKGKAIPMKRYVCVYNVLPQ